MVPSISQARTGGGSQLCIASKEDYFLPISLFLLRGSCLGWVLLTCPLSGLCSMPAEDLDSEASPFLVALSFPGQQMGRDHVSTSGAWAHRQRLLCASCGLPAQSDGAAPPTSRVTAQSLNYNSQRAERRRALTLPNYKSQEALRDRAFSHRARAEPHLFSGCSLSDRLCVVVLLSCP